MKTVVFVDELLLVNFVISAALLLCAGLLCGRACTGLRLCIGSGAAALSTLALLAPAWPTLLALFYKAGTCCAVVAAVYGLPGVRSFFQLCAWYIALNFALCGTVILPGVQTNNLNICLPVSPGRLLLCCIGVYGLLRGLLLCFGRPRRGCFAAVLELSGVSVPVQAFHDTGFALQEPLTGSKVVLVQYAPLRTTLPVPLRAYLDDWFAGTDPVPPPELGLRFVPCSTVAGHNLLPAVPAVLRVGTTHIPGLLAAFCAPLPSPAPWTLLLGDDVGELLPSPAATASSEKEPFSRKQTFPPHP